MTHYGTADDVEEEITKLKSSKATSPFSILVTILKLFKSVIYRPLGPTGVAPDEYKLANVIPVYKKGSQTSLSNYCPIPHLSATREINMQ